MAGAVVDVLGQLGDENFASPTALFGQRGRVDQRAVSALLWVYYNAHLSANLRDAIWPLELASLAAQQVVASSFEETKPQDVLNELRGYEEKYGMDSAAFYSEWNRGMQPDEPELHDWAWLYRKYLRALGKDPDKV